MIRQVQAAARRRPVVAGVSRASSSMVPAARATRPATQASVTIGVQSSPSSATAPDVIAPALSYGAWTHANPHLTRRERVEGLRKFMQARGSQSQSLTGSLMADRHLGFADGCHIDQPVAKTNSPGISCANQPRTRADRIAQIQRFADATRAVDKIDYSQAASTEPTALKPDPIIVSPLPAGWRLSGSGGMPVFSYGAWLRSHDDSQMDRVSAARQFMRYVRQ